MPPRPPAAIAGLLAVACAGLTGCAGGASGAASTQASQLTLRLGYQPNLTHAPAIAGIDRGLFRTALGGGIRLVTETFSAGPAEMEALLGGALDAAFVGPNPAINGFVRSGGAALRIIAGATSGGAALVVQPDEGIHSAADLRGRRIATPQLGNTQDVALRSWLRDHGITTDPQGGGEVHIVAVDNATTLQLFELRQIDAAWVPEPWASRLVDEGHGTLLVDEASLWPGGRFPTTELVVATSFLHQHADAVRRLVEGDVSAVDWLDANPASARAAVNDGLRRLTQKALGTAVITDAWSRLRFDPDPLTGLLQEEADHAHAVGLLGAVDLHGLVDPSALNAVLAGRGRPTISGTGTAG